MSGNEEAAVLDCHLHLWDPRRLSYPWLAEAPALNRALTADEFAAIRPASVEAIFMEASGFTEDAAFRDGVRRLGEAGLPFDACVRWHQIPEIARLAAACRHTTIVLDHLGKPKAESRDEWSAELRKLAEQRNVVCKLSGLATELDPDAPDSLALSLLREALGVFGPERCLYGSDWPIMTLATRYDTWLDLVREALGGLSAADGAAVLRDNARRVYRLDHPTGRGAR